MNSNITLVTGIFDLGRNNAGEGFKRPFSHYIIKFTELLRALKDYNLVVYIEEQYQDIVWQNRESFNTQVRIKEIEEFKSCPFYEQISSIRKSEAWLNQTGWLRESTQASMDLYNPMVMSKMFFLHDEKIRNPFNTDYFFWIDGGLTNTVHSGYFSHDKVLNKITDYVDKFLFLSFPYETGGEIHGFERNKLNQLAQTNNIEYVCRGGFFGGHKENISDINALYYSWLNSTLSEGYMGTEESIFTLLTYLYPEYFQKHMIGGDGLVWKFFEDLKNYKKPSFNEGIQIKNFSGVNLYVITFNSPKQFQRLIESYLQQPGFVRETKNYLLDNSNDSSTQEEYKYLCTKYNFEHIKKDNLGICGGRQFIAEHFDSTDSKYYIFLEDDMNLYNGEELSCVNGFSRKTKNLFYKISKIMDKEQFDFLKFSFTEFYGSNATQWAWYNVPQNVRDRFWPEYNRLPPIGFDPNAPKTVFKNINSIDGLSYITGDIYYCNWPQILSREGNKKMFIETKWAHPFEQTWMSYMYQLTKAERLKGGVLLLSPIQHDRFDFYEGSLRREN
jgi:hypothetical protein